MILRVKLSIAVKRISLVRRKKKRVRENY